MFRNSTVSKILSKYDSKLANSINKMANKQYEDIQEADYLKYIIYWFENLDNELRMKGYSSKYTINIDFDSGELGTR